MATRAAGRGAIAPWTRLAVLVFCLLVLLAPRAATAGARAALEAWWTLLVPALLPFLLAAEAYLWGSLDAPPEGPGASLIARVTRLPRQAAAPLVAAWVAGYPVAAALADRWVRAGRLTRDAAAGVVALGSVPDPMFVTALWAPAMAHARALGIVLLGVQYASLVPVALWLRRRMRGDGREADVGASCPVPEGADDPLLAAALAAGRTLLLVAVAAAMVGASAAATRSLMHAWTAYVVPPWWREVTAGTVDALFLAEPTLPVPGPAAVIATSALAASGGLVLWLETWVLTRKSGIDLRPFLEARLIQAACAALLAAAATRIWPKPLLHAALSASARLHAAPPAHVSVALAMGLFGLLLLTVRPKRRPLR